jgi:ubiquinone/menaquinone biosynthesis C-methylase UbiE
MNIKDAYKHWSLQYDINLNKTRDLEAISLRESLSNYSFDCCLEIGCGTGKNTEWLITKCDSILAIDISDEMLSIAKQKVTDKKVSFLNADITNNLDFNDNEFNLVICSLVLEHIENINDIINKIAAHLTIGGILYIGELHPFKQYSGSKPRFETEAGEQIVAAFTHHISDFIEAANNNGLKTIEIKEYFDDNNRLTIPRILTLMFQKTSAK